MISLLSSPHSRSDENPGQPLLEKKTKREGKEEKLKEEAESSDGPFPQDCEDIRSTSLSPSSYCSTIFGEIAPIPSSCAPNLVEEDPVYLGA
jgi:hypothetical protein